MMPSSDSLEPVPAVRIHFPPPTSPRLWDSRKPAQAHTRARSPGGDKTEAAYMLDIHRQYLDSKLRDSASSSVTWALILRWEHDQMALYNESVAADGFRLESPAPPSHETRWRRRAVPRGTIRSYAKYDPVTKEAVCSSSALRRARHRLSIAGCLFAGLLTLRLRSFVWDSSAPSGECR